MKLCSNSRPIQYARLLQHGGVATALQKSFTSFTLPCYYRGNVQQQNKQLRFTQDHSNGATRQPRIPTYPSLPSIFHSLIQPAARLCIHTFPTSIPQQRVNDTQNHHLDAVQEYHLHAAPNYFLPPPGWSHEKDILLLSLFHMYSAFFTKPDLCNNSSPSLGPREP